MVVGEELREPIRAHHDIAKEKTQHLYKATKVLSLSPFLSLSHYYLQYYETLANRAVNSGHVVDINACSLDQVGILEMRYLVKRTGGIIILADEFDSPMFKQSFQKLFAARDSKGDIDMAFNGTLEVQEIGRASCRERV